METLTWVRSRRCETNACAEVAQTADGVLLRSSLRPDVVLEFTAPEWAAFLDEVKGMSMGGY